MCDISSKLVVVSGPSGAGKDTIVGGLLEIDDRFSLSVSATTRPPRLTEKNGENYYFITEKEFEEKIAQQGFIEYAKYGSNYYGTLKCDVEKRINNGKTVILVIDVQGAAKVKQLYPDVLTVFIMPPSRDILECRLRRRMTDSEEDIAKRMCIAESEIKKRCDYDYTIVNDDLDKAVSEVYNIIKENIK